MKNVLFFCMLFISNFSWGSTESWVMDTDHTKVKFNVSHLVISSVEGAFRSTQGTVLFDPSNSLKDLKNFKVDIVIDAKSIDTGNQKRDDHLRGKDFFDVEKYPTITFKTEKVESKNGKDFKIHGLLTMAGKSKVIILNTKFIGVVSAYDVKRVVFQASTKIKRADFGLTWNDIVESGPVIGSDVEISIVAQAKRKSDL